MKNILNRIKWFFTIAFAFVASFLSKVMWGDFDFTNYPAQSLYWVKGTIGRVPDPEPSLLFTVLSFLFKWIEVILVWIVFIIWIISYLKIRNIEDIEFREKRIRCTAYVIWMIFFIIALVVLFKWAINFWLLDRFF